MNFARKIGNPAAHVVFLENGSMFSILLESQRQKFQRDPIGVPVVSIAAQSFDCDPLERSPAEGGIPLIATLIGAGLQTAWTLELRKTLHDARGLFRPGDPRPQRIESGQEGVPPRVSFTEAATPIPTIVLIPRQLIDCCGALHGPLPPARRVRFAVYDLEYFSSLVLHQIQQ